MSAFDYRNFDDRRQHSAAAKAALLAKFKARPPADDPEMIAKAKARAELVQARETRTREREAARIAESRDRSFAHSRDRVREVRIEALAMARDIGRRLGLEPAAIVDGELVESVFGLPCIVIPCPETGAPMVVPAARVQRAL